jgi:hypothetical protein
MAAQGNAMATPEIPVFAQDLALGKMQSTALLRNGRQGIFIS